MTSTGRTFFAAVVSVLATVAILATVLSFYVSRVLVSSDGFSSRVVSMLHESAVQSLVVQAVTNRLPINAGDAALQPVLQSAVTRAMSSSLVDQDFRAAAQSLHSQLVSGTANQLVLTLPGIGSAIASSIDTGNPELDAAVRNIGTVTVLDVGIPPSDASDIHDLVSFGKDDVEFLIAALILLSLALIISPRRRGTLLGLAAGATVSGLLLVVIYLAGRGIVVNEFSDPDARTAAHAALSTYLGGLEVWGFVLAGLGAGVAHAAPVRQVGAV
jgi:hypothetical protein